MYGLVNQAIMDLIVGAHGSETWERVRAEAGVEARQFIAEEQYDDAITYDLVAATSAVLGVDAGEVLVAFGRHWILFTGARGWGPMLDSAGSNTREVLESLDALHARVAITMPGAQMPQFRVADADDDGIELDYFSEREGLESMVIGLLQGLGERLEDPHDVTLVGPADNAEDGWVRFRLDRSPALAPHR